MNLKEAILSKIDVNSDKLTKARKIYVLTALYLEFSTKFQNTTPVEMGKMYIETFDIENIPRTQINCNIWANIYCELLKLVGIEANIVDQGHKSVVFDIDGKIWCADATYGMYTDIARIKYGDETSNFGVSFYQSLNATKTIVNVAHPDNSKVKEIDSNIEEYEKRKANHRRNLKNVEVIKKSSLSLEEKMEVFFDRLPKLEQGYYEAKNYVYYLEDKLLTIEEEEKVGAVEFKRTNSDLSVDIIQCIYVNNKDYYLLASGNSIVKTNLKNLYKLCLLYGFSLDGRLQGFKLPSKFTPGKIALMTKLYALKGKLTKEVASSNMQASYSK